MKVVSNVQPAAWDAFLAGQPDATGYHAWAWRGIFERAFGHETVYLAAVEGDVLLGVLPLVVFRNRVFGRFAVSLPFVNYGGLCTDDASVAGALVSEAASIAARLKLSHVELRHVARRLPDLPAREHKVSMLLPLLADGTAQFASLDRKVRNQVRKAEGSGLTTRIGGVELLDAFYGVFTRNMRDLGTPVYSIRFFREILTAFPDRAEICLVDAGPVTAAAAITLKHRDTVEVPWASSRREYLAQCPNNLLYWRIIQHAIAGGAKTLDFGRSTPHEGTYRFKQQWGAQPHPLYWEYALVDRAGLPDLSPHNPRYGSAIAVWKRLPIAVTNRIGPHIVRSIP
jgi:FemAB-related protein (PEP-CTERM system-associated)